jgi:hypothetical protein
VTWPPAAVPSAPAEAVFPGVDCGTLTVSMLANTTPSRSARIAVSPLPPDSLSVYHAAGILALRAGSC